MRRTVARNVCCSTLLALCSSLPLACSSDDAPDPAATSGSAGQSSAGTSSQSGSPGGGAGSGSSGAATSGGSSNAAGTSSVTAGSSSGGTAGSGSGGSAGMSGGGGSAGSGGASPGMQSAGCSMPAGQELGKWIEQPKLNVSGTDRQWWVWLPTGYDPAKPYPVIFNFHGCGGPDNIVPMNKVAGDKAILVKGSGISNTNCWDHGPNGVDVKFFDQMLADVLAKRCADSSRVFTTGYSSGSWLVNSLECVRGDKIRASGTVSGGRQFGNDTKCVGKNARVFIHDADDMNNRIDMGNDDERDRLIAANHCMATGPVMEDPAPCARYQGCDAGYPVLWCQTSGKMHDRQDDLATAAFWKLFSSL